MDSIVKTFESDKTLVKDSNIPSEKKVLIKACKWCGALFVAKYPNQGYCSDKCKKYGYQDRSRQRQYRFYHKYGKDRYKRKNPYRGTGNLGEHKRGEGDEEELRKIENEFKRLGLKHTFLLH